jgi:methionine-rich copper-binding protein CopC
MKQVRKATGILVKMSTSIPDVKEAATILLLMFLCTLPRVSHGHAYPDHADPKVGASVSIAPVRVRIWFDSNLEPLFSTIIVQDASGKKVDNGDGRVSPVDDTLLEVGLPTLSAGTYRVIWNVVARDGHRTSGDYTFTIR